MKALVKLNGIVVFVFLSVSVKAQSLRIVYDFLQDEIHYYKTTPNDKKGKPISTPVVGRNQIITVEVVNFNKFVFAADATYTSKVVEKQSEMGFLDLMGPMVNPMSATGFFTALGGTLPDEIGRGGVLSTRGASSAYDDIRDAYNKLTGIEATMRSADYAITKLNKLKYNPYLPTDTIVNLSNHLIQNIFHKPVMNPSDFASVIVKINEDYQESMATLSSSSAAFLKEYQSYAARNSGGFEGEGMDAAVRKFSSEVTSVTKTFNPTYITQKIDYLETLYTSIIATKFKFNSSHAAKDDEIDLALSFYRLPTDDNGIPTPATGNVSSLSKVKEKNINIVVRGGVKVNTSVGMAFPGYKTTDEYINRNDTIRVQPGSKYAPNIGAFVNFYPYTGRTLQLGGTFGVGVPLQAEQRDMNMFMGLSALLGCVSRVALHGGFSLGQVKKLDGGYNVGDSYVSSDLLVPTRNVWEWGSFVGISFNISKTGN